MTRRRYNCHDGRCDHGDDQGVAQHFYLIFGKFGGSKLQPTFVQKRRLANYYDLYEKANSEPEKLQNPSVFQLKSVNR